MEKIVFDQVTRLPARAVTLVIPRRCGKTQMLLRLAEYFVEQEGKRVHIIVPIRKSLGRFIKYQGPAERCDICLIDDIDQVTPSRLVAAPFVIATTSNPGYSTPGLTIKCPPADVF